MRRIADAIRTHPVGAYFVVAFAFAWLIWISAGVRTNGIGAVSVLVGAWAPSAAAILLTAYLDGKNGLRALLRRLLIWRVGIHWYLFVTLSAAAIGLTAIQAFVLLGGTAPQPVLPPGVPPELGLGVLPIVFLTNVFLGGPLAEEFGWRGFALARLQSGMGAFRASLVIGMLWGVWHVPFFLFEGASAVVGHIPLWAFVLLTTAWSVLFAWVYNNSGGSVLLVVLYHAALNTTLGSLGLIGTTAGDRTLLTLYIALTWLVVVLVTAIYGARHLTWRSASGAGT